MGQGKKAERAYITRRKEEIEEGKKEGRNEGGNAIMPIIGGDLKDGLNREEGVQIWIYEEGAGRPEIRKGQC